MSEPLTASEREGNEGRTGLSQKTSGVARAVAGNTLWGTAGRVFGGFLALATVALSRRAMGPDGFGAYATILSFLYLFNALADGGLYTILSRDLPRTGEPARLIGTALALRLALLGACLGIGLAFFLVIPQYAGLTATASLAALSYAALSVGQLMMAVLQRHFAVASAARAEFFARFLQLISVAALWRANVSHIAPYLGILAATSAIQVALLWRAARRFVALSITTTRTEAAAMTREALPVAIALLFTLVYFRLDSVLLSLLKDLRDVGIYNLAYKLLEQLIFFPAMFVGVLTPILSEAFLRDRERFQRLFARGNAVITMGALPMAVGGWFLAGPIADLLGDPLAAAPFRVLLIATVLIFFGTMLGTSVVVAGQQRRAVWIYAFATAVNVIGNLALIPKFSYMGAAWMTVLTELIVSGGLVMVLRGAGVRFAIPGFSRIVVAVAVMAVPLVLFTNAAAAAFGVWTIGLFLLVCPAIYGVALYSLRAISQDDLRLLRPGYETRNPKR